MGLGVTKAFAKGVVQFIGNIFDILGSPLELHRVATAFRRLTCKLRSPGTASARPQPWAGPKSLCSTPRPPSGALLGKSGAIDNPGRCRQQLFLFQVLIEVVKSSIVPRHSPRAIGADGRRSRPSAGISQGAN